MRRQLHHQQRQRNDHESVNDDDNNNNNTNHDKNNNNNFPSVLSSSSSSTTTTTSPVGVAATKNNAVSSTVMLSSPTMSSTKIVSSRAETVLLSSSGDVIVCRCRDSPYPLDNNNTSRSKSKKANHPTTSSSSSKGGGWNGYQWRRDIAYHCCEADIDDLSCQLQGSATLCNPWANHHHHHHTNAANITTSTTTSPYHPHPHHHIHGSRGGLLGGAPPPAGGAIQIVTSVSSPLHHNNHNNNNNNSRHSSPSHSAASSLVSSTSGLRRKSNNNNNNNQQQPPGSVRLGPSDEYLSPYSFTTTSRARKASFNHQTRRTTTPSFVVAAADGFDETEEKEIDEEYVDIDSLIPIQSFDHTHFYEDSNSVCTQVVQPQQQQRSSSHQQTKTNDTNNHNKNSFHLYSTGANNNNNNNNNSNNVKNLRKDELQQQQQQPPQVPPEFVHGIPTFLNSFTNVKITKLSAHPLGSHVLLISNAGLLYSYGLNDYGQLGIGFRSNVRGKNKGYVMTPTIVTPIVENGGKAIQCAAGVTHSLVVVETEEQRLVKQQQQQQQQHRSLSFDQQQQQQQQADPTIQHKPGELWGDTGCTPTSQKSRQPSSRSSVASSSSTSNSNNSNSSTETIYHHQLYGFGRNDHLKIGLVCPRMAKQQQSSATTTSAAASDACDDEMEVTILPRRVALRCSVHPVFENIQNNVITANASYDWEEKTSKVLQITTTTTTTIAWGIFAIQASVDHSAALVRRPNGDVELYTWGNALHYALGLPSVVVTSAAVVSSSAAPEVAVPANDVPSSTTSSANSKQRNGTKIVSSSSSSNDSQPQKTHHTPPTVRIVPVPSFVASLSRKYNNNNNRHGEESQSQIISSPNSRCSLLREEGEYPMNIALGPKCTFVVTSIGRCFAFGTSNEGMLGHGHGITEQQQPFEVVMSVRNEFITAVSAGAAHVLAQTQSGNVYGWGVRHHFTSSNIGSDNGGSSRNDSIPSTAILPNGDNNSRTKNDLTSLSIELQQPIVDPQSIQWTPMQIDITKDNRSSSIDQQHMKQRCIVEAHAGYDCSIFVSESGMVYSSGKMSGRLGQGETKPQLQKSQQLQSVSSSIQQQQQQQQQQPNYNNSQNSLLLLSTPQPLFGGLRLFNGGDGNQSQSSNNKKSNNKNINLYQHRSQSSILP